jgi:hypothetical protein
MGWEGTEVTPQIRTLIEDHHLGAILLTTKNLKSKYSFLPSAYETLCILILLCILVSLLR